MPPISVKVVTKRLSQRNTEEPTFILPVEDVPLLAHYVVAQELKLGDTLIMEFIPYPEKGFISWFRRCLKDAEIKVRARKDPHIFIVSLK
jgi:hypothetical protein